jgi:hypothetical protein
MKKESLEMKKVELFEFHDKLLEFQKVVDRESDFKQIDIEFKKI